jgi:hypothetical protein
MIQSVKKLTLCLLIVLLVLQTPAFCIKKKHRKVKQQTKLVTHAAKATPTQPLKKKDYKKNYLDFAIGTYVGAGAVFTWNLYDLVGLRVGRTTIESSTTYYHAGFNVYLFKDSNHSPYMGLGITSMHFSGITTGVRYFGMPVGNTLDINYFHLGYSTEVHPGTSIEDSIALHLSAEVSRIIGPDLIAKSDNNLWGGQISVGAVF